METEVTGMFRISEGYGPLRLDSPTIFSMLDSVGGTFDVSSAEFVGEPFDISGQDTVPVEIEFSTDGTKMFVVGNTGNDINEYTCTAFDVSTCSFVDSFDVSTETISPVGLAFSNDGTKMFVAESNAPTEVYEYDCTSFDVSTCSVVASGQLDISGQDTAPQGIHFSNDGTKMFMIGSNTNRVYEYSLSETFNITSSTLVQNFSTASEDGNSRGMTFNSDGTRMYVIGNDGNEINDYLLSNAFNISDVTFIQTFDVSIRRLAMD